MKANVTDLEERKIGGKTEDMKMEVCPYCGSEIGEFDCICGKCGMTIELQGDNRNLKNNSGGTYSGNQHNEGGNSEYGSNTGIYGNSSTSEDYSVYPPYNPANDNYGYPNYNNSEYGSNQGLNGNGKKKSKGLVLGIAIAVVLFVIGIILEPIIKNSMTKEYRHVTQKSIVALMENDIISFSEVYLYDMSKMINDLSGNYANQVNYAFNGLKEETKKKLRETYGEDYKITTEIKSVTNVSTSKQNKAAGKTKTSIEDGFISKNLNINVDDYFDISSIEKMKQIVVEVKISGSKKSRKEIMKIDLVKVKGKSDWKVLEIYGRKD